MRTSNAFRLAAGLFFTLAFGQVGAQQAVGSITLPPSSASPGILLVNPVTNKLIVVGTANTIDIVDGATHARTTVTMPGPGLPLPNSAAINPITNKVYMGGGASPVGLFELDGATNVLTNIDPGGKSTTAIVVNPVTNKVYAAHGGGADNEVTVFDAANGNAITRLTIPNAPYKLALNAVTNRVYVLSATTPTVTEIDPESTPPNQLTPITVGTTPPKAIAVNPVTNKIWITDSANNVYEVDGVTRLVTGPVTTVANSNMRAIAVNPATNKIYVSNSGNPSPWNVTVIDGATRVVDATVPVSAAAAGLVVDPVMNRVYVTNEGSNTPGVDVIDGATNTVTSVTYPVGGSYTSVAVNPVTGRVYLADANQNLLQVIDRSTYAQAAGPIGTSAAMNPITGKIYVADYDTNSLRVLDAATNVTLATLNAAALGITEPHAVALDPVLNKVWVLGQLGTVAVINGATDTVVTSFDIGVGLSRGSRNIAVNPINHKVYVSMWAASRMKVIDGVTHAELATLTLPNRVTNPGAGQGAFPEAIAVNTVTNRVFVVNTNTDNVTVIDGATDSIVKFITVGAMPKGIDVNPVTNRIYVANFNGQSVSEIFGDTIDNASPTVNTYTLTVGQVANVAVNPLTNKIFGARTFDGAFVLDGATGAVTELVITGADRRAVVVDSVRNKAYLLDEASGDYTVIDGATLAFTNGTTGAFRSAPVLDPVTGKVFLMSRWGMALGPPPTGTPIAILDPAPTSFTEHRPGAGLVVGSNGSTSQASPALTVTTSGTYSPNDPAVRHVYFRQGDALGAHLTATGTGPYGAALSGLSKGLNFVSLFALDAMAGTGMSTESPPTFGGFGASPTMTGAPRVFAFVYTGPPEIATATLPGGDTSTAYSQQLKTYGGVGTITHTLSAGALPNGLSLSAAGAITGTPTSPNTFNFTIVATDSLGTIGTKALSIVIAADTVPDAFSFVDVSGVARNAQQTSAVVTITGINAAAAISVSGGSYSVGCTATYITTASTISNNQTVCVRHTSAATHLAPTNTVLTVGGVSDTFTTTTLAGVQLTAAIGGTSGTGTIAGTGIACPGDCTELFDPGAAVSLTATPGASTLFTGWTGCDSTSGTGGVQCNVTMNADKAVSAGFTAHDTTPNAFTLTDHNNVNRNELRTSGTVTILGINVAAPISVTGGEYSIGCNGTFTSAASTIASGQTVCVRHTTAATNSAATNTVLTVGGVSDTWTTTTLPGFTLTAASSGTGSGTITGTGINCPGDCTELVDQGTQVVLTATPSGSHAFTSWTNCTSVAVNQCTVVVGADRTVTAQFNATNSFNMFLEGWQQQPYVITAATGSGTAIYNPGNKQLTLALNFTGLESAETMAHIHGPAARGANAGVLHNLPVGAPKNAVVTLTASEETMLLAGQLYVNVHTTNRPDGEIRAQIDNVGATVLRTLTVTRPGAGDGTVSGTTEAGTVVTCPPDCTESIPNGEQVTLTATPVPGASVFAAWNGACTGSGACVVTMDAAKSVEAHFDAIINAPAVSLSRTSIAFGGQSMATTSPSMAVVVTNSGIGTLSVSGVSIDNAQFTQTNNCGSVAAGASCTVNVRFTPAASTTASVPVSGTLSITSNASGSPHTVSLSGTAERSLVTHYYGSILGRAPDAGGKAFWAGEAARVQGLGVNVNEVWFAMAQAFYFSGEYLALNRTNSGYITDLYNTFFNRTPDQPGLDFWVGQLAGGMPREVALASFMFSAEFASFTNAIFGNTAARAEVDAVVDFYRGLLARLPDDGGFTFWVNKFRAAQCSNPASGRAAAIVAEVEAISSAYALSAEYAARARTNVQYVGDLYNAFLRRGGDLGGVLFWINQVASGAQTREQVRVQFKNSAEFNTRVQAIIAQGCQGN